MKIYRIADLEPTLKTKKEKRNWRLCPVCNERWIAHCKCPSQFIHTLEDLKNGHGIMCKNGHRWSEGLVWSPEA